MGKKKERIKELEKLCGQMRGIVFTMADDLGVFHTKPIQDIMDTLNAASEGRILTDTFIPTFDSFSALLGDRRITSQWGYHAIFDCRAGAKEVITNGALIEKFIRDLVVKIDMKAFGSPILQHFATHDPEKGGYTALQMIETSAIAGHFVDKNGDFYLDIFSCKPFNIHDARNFIQDFFKPTNIVSRFISRQA